MKRIFTLIFSFLIITGYYANAQTIYRSIANGGWATTATWEVSTDNGVTWNPASGTPTTNQSVFVNHEVSLGAARNILNLTINSGGRVYDAGTNALRIAAGSSGTLNNVGVLTNNGILGGTGSLMPVELHPTGSSMTITGSGTAEIGRIRPSGANNNTSAIIIIDQNIKLNTQGNYVLSAYNGGTATENNTVTINAGRTVTTAVGTGYLHNGGNSSIVAGSYTYNIDGVLDLSATTGNVSLSPNSTPGSLLTVNINGTLILGSGNFSMDTVSAGNPVSWVGGSTRVNIGTSGILDASLANATFRTGLPLGQFITISGDGAIKRTAAGGTDVLFPIGTSLSSYNPVIINNTGTSDVFTVQIKNTLDNSVPQSDKIVNKQWMITEGTTGGTNATLKLGWTTADQASTFNPAGAVVIARWNGSIWEPITATVSGSGTIADPFIATASGLTTFGSFIVANAEALPVTFIGVNAAYKDGVVKIMWQTSNELNTQNYVIERSGNGTEFNSIATTPVKDNISTVANYTWIDNTPLNGMGYYRIKAVEKDGQVSYTNIVKVNSTKGKAEVNVAPNPVKSGSMNILLTSLEKGTYQVSLYNNVGQVVYTTKIATDGGSLSHNVILPSSVRSGIYNLQVTGNEIKLNKRVVVE